MKPVQPFFRRAGGQALALEARLLFDAATVATAVAIDQAQQGHEVQGAEQGADLIRQGAGTAAPSLSATPSNATLDVLAGGDVALFSGTRASTNDADSAFTNLVLTVNSSGAREALVIDGTEIALQSANGATANAAYGYIVTTSGGVSTITLALEASNDTSAAHIQALVDGIRYKALDASIDGGTRTITLTSIQDDGSSDAGNSNTTALAVASTITLQNDTNRAPTLRDNSMPALAQNLNVSGFGATDLVYARDGRHAYAAGANGSLITFEVNGQGQLVREQVLSGLGSGGAIGDISVTADGRHLYAVAGDPGTASATLLRLDIGGDGTLSGAVNPISGVQQVVNVGVSADGSQVYASTRVNGLYVFNRDSQSGGLTEVQRINEGDLAGSRTRAIVAAGDHVFVVSNANIVTLARHTDGALRKIELASPRVGYQFSTFPSLAASSDGRVVVVAEGSTVYSYQLVDRGAGAGPELLAAGTTTLAGVNGLTVSPDGRRLYATSTAGTLSVYALGADGQMRLQGALANIDGARAVSAAHDGRSVVVTGADLTRHTLVQTVINGSERPIAAGLTLADSNLDRRGDSGNYQGASIVIARAGGAAADDRYGFAAGAGLALVNGSIIGVGGALATFTENAGTLTVTFSAAVSTAEANAVLRQITYRNSGAPASGEVSMTVRVSDGQLDGAATVVLALGPNTPPVLSANGGAQPVYTTAGELQALFSAASVNTGQAAETGQLLRALTVRIDGVPPNSPETLLIDGSRIDLGRDGSGTTAGGLLYSYTRSGERGDLVLESSVGIGGAALQGVVNGMRYVNDSGPAMSGTRQLQLAALSDNGGGADTAAPAVTTTITLAVNNAPQISAWSPPDAALFYADSRLTGYTERVSSLSVSADGTTLYISGSTGDNLNGEQYLRVYARDTSNGSLTLLQSFTQGAADNPATDAIEVDGLRGLSQITVSADGNHVYAAGQSASGSLSVYSLVLFTRNADGTLNYQGVAATQGATVGGLATAGLDAPVTEIVLSSDGKSLYTINGMMPNDGSTGKSVIASFARNTDSGALTFIGAYTGGSAELGMNQPSSLVVSGDGRSAYVSNARNNMITIFARDTGTGVLTYSGVVNPDSIAADPNSAVPGAGAITRYMQNLSDIAISPDGRQVYVASGDVGSIAIFQRQASGALVFAGAVNGAQVGAGSIFSFREIAMSADGKALYATTFGSRSIVVFARDSATGILRAADHVTGLSTVSHLAVSSDGRNIYTGTSSFFPGVDILNASANRGYAGQGPTPFASMLNFSDADFDARNNYQGVVLQVTRAAPVPALSATPADIAAAAAATAVAAAGDRYGFIDGDGLSLVNGKIMQAGSAIADVSGGAGSLTIRITAAISRESANQILRQMSYQHDPATAPSVLRLAVTVGDGSKSATEVVALQTNRAPELAQPGYTPPRANANAAYSAVLPEQLFTDLDGDALTWRVTGLPPGYSFDADTRTISGTVAVRGSHAVVIEVRDEAGNMASYRTTLLVAVDAQLAPTLDGDEVDLSFDRNNEVSGSETFSNVVAGARDSVAAGNGRHLYVVSVNANGDAMLAVLERGADGQLSEIQTLFQLAREHDSNLAGLAGINRVVLSADQRTVYAISAENNSMLAFRRDADSGNLSLAGRFDGAQLGAPITDLVSRDGLLYLAAGDSLSVLRQDGATFSLLRTYQDGGVGGAGLAGLAGLAGANRLLLSGDGRHLYVAGNGGSSTLISAYAVGADGVLTRTGGIERAGREHYGQALALSGDGSTLYVINNGEPASVEALRLGADGSVSTLASYALEHSGADLAISADGRAVFVVGEGQVSSYLRAADGTLTRHAALGEVGSDFSGLSSVTLSADGRQLYVSGTVGTNGGLLGINLSLPALTYTEGDGAKVIIPTGTLTSPTRDAGNYQGVSLTLARQDGAVADDRYGLLAQNGLELVNGDIHRNGTLIATMVEQAGQATITFTAAAGRADAQQVLRQLTYRNSSNDPSPDGQPAHLQITMVDGSDIDAVAEVQLDLIGINAPSTLDSTVLNPTLRENGDYVSLFSNTRIDTIEAGQRIWKTELVFDSAGPNEMVRYDGAAFALVSTNGVARLANGQEYQVMVADGKATVIIFMNLPVTRAASIIDSISYNNLGTGLAGTRSVILRITEMPTGVDTAPTTELAQRVTITLAPSLEANTAPVLQAPATVPAYTERGPAIMPAAGVTLADTQMDRLGTGGTGGTGNYAGATLSVTLGAGASSADTLGFSAANSLALVDGKLTKNGVEIGQASTRNGTLTIVFSDSLGVVPTREDVQNTLRQITYQSTERSPATSVTLGVTLADRQLSSAVLSLQITVSAINDAPQLSADPVTGADRLLARDSLAAIAGLEKVISATLSADGATVYVGDERGAIAILARDPASGDLSYRSTVAAANGLGAIRELMLASDGKTLYAIGQLGERQGLAQFNRATDGSLAYAGMLINTDDNQHSIGEARSLVESADGKAVYAMSNSALLYFSRNSDSGALTFQRVIGGSDLTPVLWQATTLAIAGDTVFVSNRYGEALITAYQYQSNGELKALASINGSDIGLQEVRHSAVSADGTRLYLATADAIQLLRFDAATQRFTHVGALATGLSGGLNGISDLTLSGDGRVLYASSAQTGLSRYAIDGERLLHIDASSVAGAGQVLTSADGGVLVVGTALTVFDERQPAAPTYALGGAAVALAPTMRLSDAELDAAAAGRGNYQGASLTVTRTVVGERTSDSYGFANGNGLRMENGQIIGNGGAIATLVQQDGVLTVRFTGAATSAEARAVLNQLTYADTGANIGSVPLQLTFSDGAAQTGFALTVNVVPAATGPGTNPGTPTTPTDPGTPTTPVTPGNPDQPGTPTIPTVPETPAAVAPVILAPHADWYRETSSGQPAASGHHASSVGMPADSGTKPLTSSKDTLDLLDTLRLHQETEQPLQGLQTIYLADGSLTPLAVLGAMEGPSLTRTTDSLHGAWRADPAGNRQWYALPPALFASRAPLAELRLQMRDGRPLPAGVRLDLERGLVSAQGLQAIQRTLTLELVARDIHGDSVTVTLTLAPGTNASTAGSERQPVAEAAGKPPLTMQLRQHAARDLLAQAQQLLQALGQQDQQDQQAPAASTANMSSDSSAAPQAGAHTIES